MQRSQQAVPFLLMTVVILLGINLRPALAAIGPLLDQIQADTGLGDMEAGLLTTLPVLAMGFGALCGNSLRKYIGEQRGVTLGIILIAVSCFGRGIEYHQVGLIVTALTAGIGIAFIQALLPGFIKRCFPNNSGQVMGLYSSGIMGGAALAASSSAWLAHSFSWPLVLALWGVPALLAWGLWHYCGDMGASTEEIEEVPSLSLWDNSRAWLLMLFFGIGTGAYTLVLAWLPPYYTSLGWTAVESGLLMGCLMLTEVTSGLIVSIWVHRFPDRRVLLLLILGLMFIGLLCLIFVPISTALPTSILLGIGIGALFPLSLIVTFDHLDNPIHAGELLAFVQGGGYLVASVVPFLAGYLREQFDDLVYAWELMAVGCVILMIMAVRFSPATYDRVVSKQAK